MENKFEKTQELPLQKFIELLDDSFGFKLKLSDLPVGYHLIMKIVAPVEKKVVEQEQGDDLVFYTLPCEYYNPKVTGGKVSLKVQCGASAIARLEEKYPNNAYVGTDAFFQKTKFGNKFPQFINPIKNPIKVMKKEDLLSGNTTKEDTITLEPQNNTPQESTGLPPVTEERITEEMLKTDPEIEKKRAEYKKVIDELLSNPLLGSWAVYAKRGESEFEEAYNGTADRLGLPHIAKEDVKAQYKVYMMKY